MIGAPLVTSVEVTEAAPARVPRTGRMSAVLELLAVGGLTLLLLPLSLALQAYTDLSDAELAVGFVMFHAAHFINDPHFSVTYLLFYSDARQRAFGRAHGRAQRLRYLVAGLIVPALLLAWAALALGLRSAQLLGAMVQLMFLLVGWHYAKQGFGVLTVLSARRGVRFEPRERAVVLGHCYAAWTFAWSNPAQAAGLFEEHGVVYWAPAHPSWLELLTGTLLAGSTLSLLWVLGLKWRRERRLPFTPLLGFIVTIWLWTIYTRLDPLLRYVIPALHSLQYMYFVWLMKRNEARVQEGPPTFGPPVAARLGALSVSALVLGWLLFRGAPALLDDTFRSAWGADGKSAALGQTPIFAAIFVIVNIHHYFMDNVLWRRDNPQTRYLADVRVPEWLDERAA